jgi:hypothetical protein
VIHPVILWQLTRNGVPLEPSRRAPLVRLGRRRATDDPTAPPRRLPTIAGRCVVGYRCFSIKPALPVM